MHVFASRKSRVVEHELSKLVDPFHDAIVPGRRPRSLCTILRPTSRSILLG